MFRDLKPVLILLLRFFGVYFGLIALYQFYLSFYDNVAADPFTRLIAEQSSFCIRKAGYRSTLIDAPNPEILQGIYFYINKMWPTIMVEGCNALSIMILFLAFIFTFYKGVKTFWFALLGLVFIHIVNVVRIAVINIVALKFSPEQFHFAHDYIFPAVIYGAVVLLWIVWIQWVPAKKSER